MLARLVGLGLATATGLTRDNHLGGRCTVPGYGCNDMAAPMGLQSSCRMLLYPERAPVDV